MTAAVSSGSLFEATPEGNLEGVVRRIVYSNAETAWTVLRLDPEGGGRTVTVVGPLLGVRPGERLCLRGEWIDDRQFGRQFRATSYLSIEPTTSRGIERFLGSGLIPGIGAVMAERLVERFGLQTLEVIEKEVERLTEVPGIGPKRAAGIQRAWRRQRGLREILIFLQSHGIGPRQALRIYRHYGDRSVAVLRSNPYRLAAEVVGFGFHTADEIASRLGIGREAPMRAEAAVLHVLAEAEGHGHMFLPEARVRERAGALLGMPAESLRPAIDRLAVQQGLIRETPRREELEPALYSPRLYTIEVELAARLRELLEGTAGSDARDRDADLEDFRMRHGLELSSRQELAIRRALADKLLVITGGPGTGKTTLVKAIVELSSSTGSSVLLAAPTGRAAKRLGEATGVEARTLHRLLEFDAHRWRFQRHRKRPLAADLVIVDEASMLDCPLARHLLDAIPDACRLVLVGDADQLPSVGPGRLLADLIDSGVIPVVRLSEVFRQAAESLIVSNAHRIRDGKLPVLETRRPVDFYFIDRREPEQILETLRDLLLTRIPRRFKLDPRRDIQVLTPMRKGLVGVERLNRELQRWLNPDAPPLEVSQGRLRNGDRVMQTRNNYDLDVFNGDVGQVTGVGGEGQGVTVEFDGRSVEYPSADIDDLVLAYACSVHKAQGSEYPCVIMPLHSQHHLLLQRNLLYTAVTRGQRLVILLGEPLALSRAVRNDRPQERFTRLLKRLGAAPPIGTDRP